MNLKIWTIRLMQLAIPSESSNRGDDRKFSKMVELLGPQNRKMVELQGVKFAQNSLFQIFLASLAPRPILSFKTTLYIKFDHIRQLFSKFRHFRSTFHKNIQFSENFLKI